MRLGQQVNVLSEESGGTLLETPALGARVAVVAAAAAAAAKEAAIAITKKRAAGMF